MTLAQQGETDRRALYKQAHAALDAAHQACFGHSERDALGMSHGPFSGVNQALGIIARLEDENWRLRLLIEELQAKGDLPTT